MGTLRSVYSKNMSSPAYLQLLVKLRWGIYMVRVTYSKIHIQSHVLSIYPWCSYTGIDLISRFHCLVDNWIWGENGCRNGYAERNFNIQVSSIIRNLVFQYRQMSHPQPLDFQHQNKHPAHPFRSVYGHRTLRCCRWCCSPHRRLAPP